MCNPAALATTFGLQAGVNFLGQQQQAKAQEAYQAQASLAERQRAIQEQRSIRMRQGQEQEAINREIFEASIEGAKKESTNVTSAGEANVSGLSVDAVVNNYKQQEAAYRLGLTGQQEMRDVQAGLALTDAGFRTVNRQIGINRIVSQPSAVAAVLDAGAQAASGYRTGLDIFKS